jgi:D-tyrosyl-tRNA(Tyr) deacylase
MRIVLQRVSRASVAIGGRVVGAIERGFCLLVGFTHTDTPEQLRWMADKIAGLRIFSDAEDKMNLALADIGGAVLVVSQFTLYGDARRGRRPGFSSAAAPEEADRLYRYFVTRVAAGGLEVKEGVFGAMMDVRLVNHGPVTILLDSTRAF